jgi:hypothetical protein
MLVENWVSLAKRKPMATGSEMKKKEKNFSKN